MRGVGGEGEARSKARRCVERDDDDHGDGVRADGGVGGVAGGRDHHPERHLDRGQWPVRQQQLLERPAVARSGDDRERMRAGLDHRDRGVRQSAGDGVGDAASEATYHHQLLRRLAGPCRHAGGDVRDDVQRVGADDRRMAVRLLYVRRVELAGRVLQHQLDPASDVHLGGPLLGDRQAPEIPHHHDQEAGRVHAARLLDHAGVHLVHADLHGLVHHRGEQRVPAEAPGAVRVQGEQGVRDILVEHLVLDTVHHHDPHVLRRVQRGEQAGEADAQPHGQRDAAEPQAEQRPEQLERRAEQRRIVQNAHAQRDQHRSPAHAHQGQEHHEDEERAQGCQDVGHHHGYLHNLLVAVLLVVRLRIQAFETFLFPFCVFSFPLFSFVFLASSSFLFLPTGLLVKSVDIFGTVCRFN